MKQSINPAVAIALIAVVAVIAIFFIYKGFVGSSAQGPTVSNLDYKQKMEAQKGTLETSLKNKQPDGMEAKMKQYYGAPKTSGGN